jgi:hypothetical protein
LLVIEKFKVEQTMIGYIYALITLQLQLSIAPTAL